MYIQPIVREKKRFAPFTVPASLGKQLPFKSREKDWVGKSTKSVLKPQVKLRRDAEERKVGHSQDCCVLFALIVMLTF